MKVNIAVCGRFHFHKYVKYLEKLGFLHKLYCSYRRGYGFEVPRERLENLWLKEHLLYAHTKTFGELGFSFFLPLYHRIWERSALRRWSRPNLAHIMLHGTALALMQRCETDETPIIGEAVNAHPDIVTRILSPEYERLGLRYPHYARIMERHKEEIGRCDRILAPSRWVARSYEQAGVDSTKVEVLPYPSGVRAGGARKRRRNESTVRILCVGGLQVRKGQHYLLNAVNTLNSRTTHTKFEVTLVGQGRTSYMRILRGISGDFHHVSHVPNAEMPAFMGNFDVFALASLEDGFSVAVCEALEAGLPVVTTENVGAADVVVEGRNGFVVPAQDSARLADAIANAADMTLEFEANAPGRVGDWKEYAQRLSQIYRRCAHQRTFH
jgi:glycosyltransferase involved in cell wall biosynthesis